MKIILTCEFSSESYTHASVGLEFRIFWCTITVAFAPSIYYHGDGFVHKFLHPFRYGSWNESKLENQKHHTCSFLLILYTLASEG